MWGIDTPLSLPMRLLCSVLIFAIIGIAVEESWRYVDRKESRHYEPSTAKTPDNSTPPPPASTGTTTPQIEAHPHKPTSESRLTEPQTEKSAAPVEPKPVGGPFDETVAHWRTKHNPYGLTLHDLYLTDFDGIQQRNFGSIFVNDPKTIEVQYEIAIDLTQRSKLIAFYVKAHPNERDICSYLAKQYKYVLDNAPAQLMVEQKGVGDSSVTTTKEAIFTGRVYIYHETYLDAETTVALTKEFSMNDAAAIFRSVDYLSTKRLEAKVKQQQ